jgi:hypothetical protein
LLRRSCTLGVLVRQYLQELTRFARTPPWHLKNRGIALGVSIPRKVTHKKKGRLEQGVWPVMVRNKETGC